MTPSEAKALLLRHQGPGDGLLGSLRPYGGTLDERHFHEIMAAVRALRSELQSAQVDRQVVTALWGICHLCRAWALEPEGMLRSNGLIASSDQEKLANWVNAISYTVMVLLDGADEATAFEFYEKPREECGS